MDPAVADSIRLRYNKGSHFTSFKLDGTPMPLHEDQVREALKKVIDPELFINIVDLGLVYVITVVPHENEPERYDVHVEMTMTSPMCPAGPQLVAETRKYAGELAGVENVDVKVVMDPPWTQDMMSDDARDQLGIF